MAREPPFTLHLLLWPAASDSGLGFCGLFWGQQPQFQELDTIPHTALSPLFYSTDHLVLRSDMLKQVRAEESLQQ